VGPTARVTLSANTQGGSERPAEYGHDFVEKDNLAMQKPVILPRAFIAQLTH
jgi:hypothetical protein